jgi:uncharacterized protein (DUF2062 family)/2-polyprenyl-3-methyl-5-hydroxy-6-metoxy-1,4-benzoquinol methylase
MPRATAPTPPADPAALLGQGYRARLVRLWRLLRGGDASPKKRALACALGLFIGCLPLYGLHFPICLGVCLLFRLDLVVTYLAANVSNPFVAPFLVTAEVEIGSLLLDGRHAAFDLARARELGAVGFMQQAALGSVVLGGALGALGGALTFVLAARGAKQDDPVERAVARTVARYRGARPGDRYYVAGKLRHDPVLRLIAELGVPLGRTLDAGAGRGQLGLCLVELGLVSLLQGFDADERKIQVARAAAGESASFELGDLGTFSFPRCDTILLVDVLHYLPAAAQDELLLRSARALEPGGRLLLRDVDGAGPKSVLTRFLERLATATGWHLKKSSLCFRPASEWLSVLEREGLKSSVRGASQGTPFSNVLVVAERPR